MKTLVSGSFLKVVAGLLLALCGVLAFAEEITQEKIDEWTQKAETGDAQALNELGVCYSNGECVKQDKKKAFQLFQKSAEKKWPDGIYNFAICYYNGDGVEKDTDKAVTLLQEAADAGSYLAASSLGSLYLTGTCVEKDVPRGYQLTKLAAEHGVPQAEYNLGKCYENGDGVDEVDFDAAEKWYEKAAKDGSENGKNALQELRAAKNKEIKIYTDTDEIPENYQKIGSTEINCAQKEISVSVGKTADDASSKATLRDRVLVEARKQKADAVLILKEKGDADNGSISAEFYRK